MFCWANNDLSIKMQYWAFKFQGLGAVELIKDLLYDGET